MHGLLAKDICISKESPEKCEVLFLEVEILEITSSPALQLVHLRSLGQLQCSKHSDKPTKHWQIESSIGFDGRRGNQEKLGTFIHSPSTQ